MIGPGHSTYLYSTPFLYVVQHGFSSSYSHQRVGHVARHPTSPKGALMEWSRYQVIKRRGKKKKKNPLHLHLAGRCDLFWKLPLPYSRRRKSPEPYVYAKYTSRQRIGGTYSTMRRNWRENEFFTFGQTLLFPSHDVRIPFWRGV